MDAEDQPIMDIRFFCNALHATFYFFSTSKLLYI